jgi:hypothetical protein
VKKKSSRSRTNHFAVPQSAQLDAVRKLSRTGRHEEAQTRIAARKGDVERARELLTPLENREEYHFSEWRALLMTEREIAAAQQDVASIFRLDEALDSLGEQFG